MSHQKSPSDNLFRAEVAGIKPLKQDKIPLSRQQAKQKTALASHHQPQIRQAAASFAFSDGFQAHFSDIGPLKWIREGHDSHQLKQLRRGDFVPDLLLDLHGLQREQAKLEVAALIETAHKQHVHCVCIMHGIGSHVLKQAVPSWLVQHPAVVGFHQAPLEWGGQGALLILIDLPAR